MDSRQCESPFVLVSYNVKLTQFFSDFERHARQAFARRCSSYGTSRVPTLSDQVSVADIDKPRIGHFRHVPFWNSPWYVKTCYRKSHSLYSMSNSFADLKNYYYAEEGKFVRRCTRKFTNLSRNLSRCMALSRQIAIPMLTSCPSPFSASKKRPFS